METSKYDQDVLKLYWVLLLGGAWCGMIAMVQFDHYWIYKLSRWMISPVGICGMMVGFAVFTRFWKVLMVPMALISLVFNPIFQFHFPRDVWIVIDGVTAGILLAGGTYEIFRQGTPKVRNNMKDVGILMICVGVIGFFAFMAYWEKNLAPPRKNSVDAPKKKTWEENWTEKREALQGKSWKQPEYHPAPLSPAENQRVQEARFEMQSRVLKQRYGIKDID